MNNLGPNRDLPPLNPLAARSTIAAIIGILQTLLPLLGSDGGVAELATDIVANEALIQEQAEKVIRAVDVLIGVGAWLWYGLERRAPNFRLSFRRH